MGYRYQPSYRHFVGTVEQKQREILGTQIFNLYHLVDFGIERQLTPRWSVTASVPVLFGHRNQLYSPSSKQVMNAFGDASIGFRSWIFKPPTESGDNISVGVALKVPTGNYNQGGPARQGNRDVIATYDQSMMSGDGGTGFSVDVQGYKRVKYRNELYFAGVYLFNPRETNGVSTFRARSGEQIMSVTDQYLVRGGIGRALPKIRGLAASFGLRMEGVPVRDLLGGDLGFRRPGYALSIDPGLLYSRGYYTFTLNGPYAIRRDRKRSVSDIANGTAGDAAFADYTVIVSVSRRF